MARTPAPDKSRRAESDPQKNEAGPECTRTDPSAAEQAVAREQEALESGEESPG